MANFSIAEHISEIVFLIVGVCVVALAIVYFKIRKPEVQNQKLEDEKIEPGLTKDGDQPVSPSMPGEEDERVEPEPIQTQQPKPEPPEPFKVDAAGFVGLPKPDPMVDEVFRINFNPSVPGKKLLDELTRLNSLNEVVPISVWAYEETQKKWFHPDPIGSFSAVVVYLPLACKTGALNSVQLAEFNQVMEFLQMNLGGSTEPLDVPQLEKKAQKLGKLVNDFGVQLSLLLRTGAEVTLEKFEEVAQNHGLKRISDKQYEKVGEMILNADGKRTGNRRGTITLYYVDGENIVISLSVGLTTPEKAPLREFIAAANVFAANFGAIILSSQGNQEINNYLLTDLQKGLDTFYSGMRNAGLEPGSPTAHRLLA